MGCKIKRDEKKGGGGGEEKEEEEEAEARQSEQKAYRLVLNLKSFLRR